jgi:2-hydroxychromene-2-carboxylate isomerase
MCRASGFTQDVVGDLITASASPEMKQALIAATAEAAHEGAFGVPFMCLDGPGIPKSQRVWFGADALPTIAHVLNKQFVVSTVSKL